MIEAAALSAAISSIASAPELVRIKLSGVPVPFEATHGVHLAGYSGESSRLTFLCGGRQRIPRIENNVNHGVLPGPSPTIPFDMS